MSPDPSRSAATGPADAERLSARAACVRRRYGFSAFQPCGNFALASSSVTAGTMMTSSPCFQFTGVATRWASVSCSESITRRISSKLRPVRLRVGDHQADLLLGVDHEDRAHRVDLVVRGMHHPVEIRDLAVGIGDDREVRRVALRLLDVARPSPCASPPDRWRGRSPSRCACRTRASAARRSRARSCRPA